MAGKLVNEGENHFLECYLGDLTSSSYLYLGLYTNVTEPTETATLASLSEVSGTGYARIQLAKGTWTITDNVASYASQTFSATGSWGSVTGYFLGTTADDSGKLIGVEQFDYPLDIESGEGVKVTPSITLE